MVALVGPGTGPLVHTRRMGQLLVSFRELTDGVAIVTTAEGDSLMARADCILPVLETATVQVEYKGRSKKFTCIIRSQPNALHGN